jgi:zinc protease
VPDLTVRESLLDNGLKILTVNDSSSPTVSHQLWYRVGSRNEGSGTTGVSHAVEHLLFKGTDRFPEGAFDRVIQENGMVHNALTTHDYTVFYENAAADRLGIAMELESDRMSELRLTDHAFRSEMAVIREERRQTAEDPPFGLLSEAVEAAVFQVHPYRWPIIGWMCDLEKLALEDAWQHYRTFYTPNNAFLVVTGDARHERVVELAQAHYGPIPRGPEPPAVRAVEPRPRGERIVTVHKEVQLPGLLVAWRAPASRERGAKILNLIEFILLHGRSSRLYRRLVHEDRMAIGLGGGILLRTDPSIFSVRAMAQPGVAVERLRDAVFEETDRLTRESVGEKEIAKALRAVESDFVFSRESRFALGQNLGEDECRSSWRDYLDWLDTHRTIGAEEILETARRVFDERGRTVGYLRPEAGAMGNSAETGAADGDVTGDVPGDVPEDAAREPAGKEMP